MVRWLEIKECYEYIKGKTKKINEEHFDGSRLQVKPWRNLSPARIKELLESHNELRGIYDL